MTNPEKTIKELRIEKKANDDLLDASSDDVMINRNEVKLAYGEIHVRQGLASNLSEDQKRKIDEITSEADNRMNYLRDEIDKLDFDDAKSEIAETQLERAIIDTFTEAVKKRENVLGPIVNELGQSYKELMQKMDNLDEAGKALVSNHLQLVNKNIDLNKSIDNKTSLLEDYADTSVNMPSYMDPED